MPLDPGHVMGEVGGESVEPRIAAEFGEARKRRALERKALRLLVGDHLQPMFDAAQERIGLRLRSSTASALIHLSAQSWCSMSSVRDPRI